MPSKSDDLLKKAPHSSHYKNKGVEPIELIEAFDLGFHAGNAVKYIARYKEKNGIADLEKAAWYIDRLIAQERKRLGK